MFCTECGATLDETAKFCSQCGVKIKPVEKSGVEHEEAVAGEKPVDKGMPGSFHLPAKIEDTMEVKSAAISSNGEYIAINAADGKPHGLRVLETKTGKVVNENDLRYNGNVDAVCSTGQYVSIVGTMVRFVMYDMKTGNITLEIERLVDKFRSVFSHDSKCLAVAHSGQQGNSITIYDVQKGKELLTLTGHKSQIVDLAYSPDDNFLVSLSNDSIFRLWDTNSGETLHIAD